MWITLGCLGLCLSVASASVCSSSYHGTCHSFFGNNCPAGYTQSMSHCGFLEVCCVEPEHTVTHTTAAPSTGTGTGTGLHNVAGCGVSDVSFDRIVGGSQAADGEFPWQVALLYHGQQLCGGTLIDEHWVVTAAHCFEQYRSHWTVGVGTYDLHRETGSHVHQVEHIIRHASYSGSSNHNDIAMIKMSTPVDLSSHYAKAACLPTSRDTFDGVVCTATGWGSTHEGGSGSRYLRKVDVPVISNSQCSYYLGHSAHIIDSQVCAGYPQGGKDACQGDSGGPYVCLKGNRQTLVGITSWGYGCADRYKPGVYTRVSSFIDWIQRVKSQY